MPLFNDLVSRSEKAGGIAQKGSDTLFGNLTGTEKATAILPTPSRDPGRSADLHLTDEVHAAQTLVADWNKYDVGKMSGTDFSDPSHDLPQDLQDALKFVNNDTTLYNAMIKGNGGHDGDPLTKADVQKFVDDATGDKLKAGDPLTPWDAATASSDSEAFGLSDTQKAELNKPIQAAQALVENWHTWGLSSGVTDFGKVPDDIPQQGKDVLNYIESNPALLKAIGAGKDGPITQQEVIDFVGKATDDAKAGVTALNDFLKNNPDAPDATKRLAQSAAIVRGNETLFSAGDPQAKTPGDGTLTQADLENIGGQGPMQYGLGDTLDQAANLWAQPGLFNQLDVGGQDATTSKADGIANGDSITSWISKEAPTLTGPALGAMLTDVTDRGLVAGIDTSKLGPDFFDHLGDNHDGAQKAAVLQQLTDLDAKITAGVDASDWNDSKLEVDGINGDPNQVKGDIAGKIAQLTADPDVQKFKADHFGGDLQSITGIDPAFHDAIKSYYDGDLQSGKALNDALGAKDADGRPVSAEQGLESFVQTANTLSLALGTSDALGGDSKPLPGLDLQAIAAKSGQQGALQDAYTNDILSGNELKDAIAGGTDIGTAVQQFEVDAANFGATLPTQFVSDNARTLQQTFSDALSDSIEDNATTADIDTAFADKDGHLDIAKLTDAVTQATASDPSFATDSDGNKIKPDQIVSAVNAVVTDVRNGVKLDDALSKLSKANADDLNKILLFYNVEPQKGPPSGAAFETYKKGLMHAVGAVINGGVLIAKSVESGGKATPQATASILGSSFQMLGGALEGGSKYATAEGVGPLSKDALKTVESAGKAIGGAGSVIGGALSLFSGVQALKDGDKAGAGVGIGTGITGTWSGISALVEGGVGLADAALGSIGVDTAAIAATSATLGVIGGAATVLGVTGLGIYAAVEGEKRVDAFMGQIEPQLQQYGITGGTGASNDPPSDPPPPVES